MRLPEILNAEASAGDLALAGTALCAALQASGTDDTRLRALCDGDAHPAATFSAALGEAGVETLLHHGILASSAPDKLSAQLSLRYLDGLLIVTDLPRPHRHVPDDYVDPLWEGGALARLLDVPKGGLALDMGTGCGVLALTLARSARQVFAVDVNLRALRIARFNAALNGLTNVTCLESNLFSAVKNERFDIITFNSPTGEEFSSSNLQHAGEAILERFFKEVPAHLTESGTVQISLCGKDWVDEAFMTRIERFLGPAAGRYQFLFLESWRTVRGRVFFLRRLSASLRLGINAFRCKAFMKGWLVARPGPASESWSVSSNYHDWVYTEPAGTVPALIEALATGSQSALERLPPRLRSLVKARTRIPRHTAGPVS